MTGKIIKGIAGFYYVNDGENRVYQCRAKGIFRNRKIKPLVGDNVEFSILDEEAGEGNIDRDPSEKKCAGAPGGSQCGSGAGALCPDSAIPQFKSSGPAFW